MTDSFRIYATIIRPDLDQTLETQLACVAGDLSHIIADDLRAGLLGGKKIRGCLLCLTAQALGGTLEPALLRAAAVELIQTATLIHDDYVDQDRLRRKRPAVWTLAGARRAVLLGDVIFAAAIKTMNDLDRESGTIVSDTIAKVAAGALREPLDPMELVAQIKSGSMDSGFYEKVIHLKTAVLFGAACRLGAVAARANLPLRKSLQRWGQSIGEAYQIADDLHEINRMAAGRSVNSAQMASVAAACLHFAPELYSLLLEVLQSHRSGGLPPSVQAGIEKTAASMRRAVNDRLDAAARELPLPSVQPRFRKLMRAAPLELIDMFNAYEAAETTSVVA